MSNKISVFFHRSLSLARVILPDLMLIILAALSLCWLAFQNGYPFVYPDTGTYIMSGWDVYVPNDRPIGYGLFVKQMSLRESLWFTILAQATLAAYTIWLFIKSFVTNIRMHRPLFVVAIVILDFCTALPIKAAIILPDLFTPLGILLVAVLLLRTQKIHRAHSIVAAGIIIMSCCFHYSNLYILAAALAVVALLRLRKRKNFVTLTWRRIVICAALLPASWLVASTINLSVTGKFFFSQNSDVFLTGHFVHDGTMRKFLCEECPKGKNYLLCPYRDSLVGMDFLWDWNNSPLYKAGGWEKSQEDYHRMLNDMFSNPKWWPLLTQKALGQSAQQFFSFTIQPHLEAPPMGEGSPPAGQVGEHYTNELNLYYATQQKGGSLNFEDQNNRQSWLLFATVLVFVFFVFRMRRQFPELARVVVFICLALYLNALVCGAVSISNARYQSRVVWIAPLLALVILAESGILTKLAERIPFGENKNK